MYFKFIMVKILRLATLGIIIYKLYIYNNYDMLTQLNAEPPNKFFAALHTPPPLVENGIKLVTQPYINIIFYVLK